LKRIYKLIMNWKVKMLDFNHQSTKMINVSREDKALLRSNLSAWLMPGDGQIQQRQEERLADAGRWTDSAAPRSSPATPVWSLRHTRPAIGWCMED